MIRKLTDEEKRLWHNFTKTIKKLVTDVADTQDLNEPELEKSTTDKANIKTRPSLTGPAPSAKKSRNNQINEPISKQQGSARKIALEGRIDLHGDTLPEAEHRLKNFLESSQLQGKTWVLVITGKGSIHREGILKKAVPGWLNSWPYISSFSQAKTKDGGQGALYVRIKKLRK